MSGGRTVSLAIGAALLLAGCFDSFGRGRLRDAGPPVGDQGVLAAPDMGGPAVTPIPALTGTRPASPANDNEPRVHGTAAPGARVHVVAGACGGPILGSAQATAEGAFTAAIRVEDDRAVTLRAWAELADAARSACSGPLTYVEDSTPPPAPLLVRTIPESPADDPRPRVEGTAEPGATVVLSFDPACAEDARGPVAAGEDGTFSLVVTVPEDRRTLLFATATDRAGNRSACSSPGLPYDEDGPPPVEVIFPATPALTDRSTVRVRGRGLEPGGVAAVHVAGEPATTDDGFAHWWVDVPLATGDNAFEVVVDLRDGGQVVLPERVVARRDLPRSVVLDVVVDADRGILYTVDGQSRAVFAIDQRDGRQWVVSRDDIGDGPALSRAVALAVAPVSGTVYVADLSRAAVTEVHPETGDRRILSGNGEGVGPAIGTLLDLVWGADRLFALDRVIGTRRFLSIDPATGDRRVLASFVDGEAARPPSALTWDPVEARLIAYDGGVTAYDLSGASTPIANERRGVGPRLEDFGAAAIAVDERTGEIFVLGPWALVAVDPVTGDRVDLPPPSLVSWGDSSTSGLAIDGADGLAYVVNNGTGLVFTVDLETGERTVLREDVIGAGPHLIAPSSVELGDGVLYVSDAQRRALLEVDLETGDRHLLAESADLDAPTGLALDPHDGALYARNAAGQLHRLALGPDALSRLHPGDPPSDEILDHTGMVWAAAERRLLYAVGETLYAFDPEGGGRSVVHEDLLGGEGWSVRGLTQADGHLYLTSRGGRVAVPMVTRLDALALVFPNGLAPRGDAFWVTSRFGILELDAAGGQRRVIARPDVGRGPASVAYLDVVVDPDDEVGWVASSLPPAIVQIDAETRDRVIVSW